MVLPMAAVGLTPGIQVLAFKLQEAGMMQGDIRARLDDAVRDAHRGLATWGYYIDHSGDDVSGDVVYSCQGDVKMCGYEIANVNGKVAVSLDMENAQDVVPLTTYVPEADEDDHYTAMQEAKLYTEGPAPLIERFISKGERDKADEGSFAGKGKSFPILKPSDVGAAVHAMGRAGSSNYGMSKLKANIIQIAKAKGWTSELPKAWRGDGSTASEALRKSSDTPDSGSSGAPGGSNTQEAAHANVPRETLQDSIRLFESAAPMETILIKEARADYEMKLIAPGKGSSAIYPAEVLKRDGPNVFKAGTHIYLNHPTAAEEAARPEGDVKNLAGVLTTDAVYRETHAKGPGLYARMKVFADHGQMVEEKAAHVGMSIRASGVAESGKKQDGLPVLKELTSAESVDVVTRAGAGGMILTEAARPNSPGGEMTLEEAQTLIAAGIEKATQPLIERGLRLDAREEATRILEGVTLPAQAKLKITERAVSAMPKKDGALDVEEFRKLVVAEAKAEGEYLASVMGSGAVRGLGASFAAPVDPEKLREAKKREQEAAQELELAEASVFGELTGLKLVKGRAA